MHDVKNNAAMVNAPSSKAEVDVTKKETSKVSLSGHLSVKLEVVFLPTSS